MKSKKRKVTPSKTGSLIGKVGGYGGHPRQFTKEESEACFEDGVYSPSKAAMIYRGMMSEYDYDN